MSRIPYGSQFPLSLRSLLSAPLLSPVPFLSFPIPPARFLWPVPFLALPAQSCCFSRDRLRGGGPIAGFFPAPPLVPSEPSPPGLLSHSAAIKIQAMVRGAAGRRVAAERRAEVEMRRKRGRAEEVRRGLAAARVQQAWRRWSRRRRAREAEREGAAYLAEQRRKEALRWQKEQRLRLADGQRGGQPPTREEGEGRGSPVLTSPSCPALVLQVDTLAGPQP